MSGFHPPVVDWATDFDHTDPVWSKDPYPIWDDLRDSCPVAHSERYGGVWLPTRHEDISAVAYDTEHFTSQSVVVSEGRPLIPAPVGVAPPITSDPPFHQEARRLLLPAFSPRAVAELEPFTRDYCTALLDTADLSDGSVVDAATAYAQHIPVRVIAHMLGFPAEDADTFRDFVHVVLETVDEPVERRAAAFEPLAEYLETQIRQRIDHPRDDLTTFLLRVRLEDGTPLSADHVAGTIALLLIAGIDTTWSAIGSSLWHLAANPDDRRRLTAEPELMDFAIEEFLRAYAPVTMARLVKQDFDFNGCPMEANEWVLLPFGAANRDPTVFEDADRVVIDRQRNRHAAFGLGIHRCLGSNLARMELRVAVETWLRHVPEFHLSDPGAVTWSSGQVRGPRTLPVVVGPQIEGPQVEGPAIEGPAVESSG